MRVVSPQVASTTMTRDPETDSEPTRFEAPAPTAAELGPSWGLRLSGVEGLRGIAAFSVLVAHLAAETTQRLESDNGPFWTVAGLMRHGLTLFFVLSGFLLFRPFVSAMVTGRRAPSAGQFLRNRALRIFPGYVVILLLVSLVLRTARLSSAPPTTSYERSGTLTLTDTLVSLPLLQTLVPDYMRVGLGAAWSLTVEFCFYLLLPVLAYGALRFTRRSTRVWHCALAPGALLLVVGLTGKGWVAAQLSSMTSQQQYAFQWGHHWTAVGARSILVHGDLFAYGMFVAVVYVAYETGRLNVSQAARIRGAALPIALGCAIASARHLIAGYEDSFAACAASGLLLLVILNKRNGTRNRAATLLDSTVARQFGVISYGIYLWHIPVIWWLQKRNLLFPSESVPAYLGNLVWVVGISAALATLTYQLAEKPALARKKRTDASASVAAKQPSVGAANLPLR
jgi:peptidoglycan/LPS O-acetylase OafA/YrhL